MHSTLEAATSANRRLQITSMAKPYAGIVARWCVIDVWEHSGREAWSPRKIFPRGESSTVPIQSIFHVYDMFIHLNTSKFRSDLVRIPYHFIPSHVDCGTRSIVVFCIDAFYHSPSRMPTQCKESIFAVLPPRFYIS